MEERRGLRVKDLLIRLILIIIFIFLLIWLFPTPNLKPLNNQIFADNVARMKDAAKSYYTVERLPKDINTSKRMTLKEMIDNHLILPLMDSNGKYCNPEKSYVQITKLENEYIIKVKLSCSDKSDYIIEHYGCYDICSNKCKMLETTTTTKTTKLEPTTKKGALYEYKFYKDACTSKFSKYVCPTGYTLIGDKCVKNGSIVDTKPVKEETEKVVIKDEKPAKAVITPSESKEKATCNIEEKPSTIDATPVSKTSDEVLLKTQNVTADKNTITDRKGAVGTITTLKSDYIKTQNYDVITATKIAHKSEQWVYVSTLTSLKSNLAFSNDSEKLVLVDSWSELMCDTCFTTVTIYKYYRYKYESDVTYTYSCDAFSGYSLYDGNKCRKPTTITKSCPSGYTDTGKGCEKKNAVVYSCAKYGSDYVLNESDKSCTKTTVTYSCPKGTTKTSDPKVCTKKIYGCATGTSIGNGKCSTITYTCPANTNTKTYTLTGTKCAVKTKVKVCTCPFGTIQTEDKLYCVKSSSVTEYSCKDLPGYKLDGTKCVKTTTTDKVNKSCDKGYTLTGDKCIKTTSTTDTKKAEAIYNTTCSKNYIWSTKTSVDGWTYTGIKRLLTK